MFKPTRDNMMVRPEEAETVTASGIIFEDKTRNTLFYIIEEIGPEVEGVEVGDTVLLPRLVPTFDYENKEYYIVNYKNIMAIKLIK